MTTAKPKALLLGDYENAPYHPLGAVEETLLSILSTDWEIAPTDRYELLASEELNQYRLCISYADRWESPLTSEETAGLLRYVAGGGGLLILHNGISLQARSELAQLAGARFTGHPEYTELPFRPSAKEHPVLSGIGPFVMDEEPYRFEQDGLSDHEVLLTYSHDGQDWPAAWTKRVGLGRMVYLMPGHHRPSFEHAEYAKLVRNGAAWAGKL